MARMRRTPRAAALSGRVRVSAGRCLLAAFALCLALAGRTILYLRRAASAGAGAAPQAPPPAMAPVLLRPGARAGGGPPPAPAPALAAVGDGDGDGDGDSVDVDDVVDNDDAADKNDAVDKNDGGSGGGGGSCAAARRRAVRDRTEGLTAESLLRSRAWVGNRQRLDGLAGRLLGEGGDGDGDGNGGVHAVTLGGSITLGHGIKRQAMDSPRRRTSGAYPKLLERWLNREYGREGKERYHRVTNLASHGADMCALEKRLGPLLADLEGKDRRSPDLFLLEFAVNDYQGQDHVRHVDSRTDVFFPGFSQLALCAEVVVSRLLRSYPRAAVAFLEFRTAIPGRRTGALLHAGVAQHYEVPVISYSEAMFPEYFRLVSRLNETDRYTVPEGDTVLPYPYGCHPCDPGSIADQFNHFSPSGKRCRTVCDLVAYGGGRCDMRISPPPGREYCHPAIFAVDAVHPSQLGHRIALDLVAHAISSAVEDRCRREPFAEHVLPGMGWLATPEVVEARGNFALVNDTDCFLPFCEKLLPSRSSGGFTYYSDVKAANFDKFGWISTNQGGGESIAFDLDLPRRPCYAVYVAVLRSYEGMGQFSVTVEDKESGRSTTVDLDGLWAAHISVWSDNQIVGDDAVGACTGKCTVVVRTKAQVPGRGGNKVKVLTLSARECSKNAGKGLGS